MFITPVQQQKLKTSFFITKAACQQAREHAETYPDKKHPDFQAVNRMIFAEHREAAAEVRYFLRSKEDIYRSLCRAHVMAHLRELQINPDQVGPTSEGKDINVSQVIEKCADTLTPLTPDYLQIKKFCGLISEFQSVADLQRLLEAVALYGELQPIFEEGDINPFTS